MRSGLRKIDSGSEKSNFYWADRYVTKPSVICGQCALARNSLTTQNTVHLDLFTILPEIDGVGASIVTYIYRNPIDYDNYVAPMDTNENLLLPTKERAIVEYILVERWCDEGTLIEALKTYLEWEENREKLYEVADFYGLPRETLDYWIHEAETDEEV